MRKFVFVILAAIIILPACVCGAEEYTFVDFEVQLGSYVAFVNGETKSIEAPFLQNGYSMVPVDAISSAFGKESKDEVTYNGITIEFTEGSIYAMVGDDLKQMPVPAKVINGSLMVSIRFVCDTFNALIEFEETTGTIKVSKSADFTDLFNKPLNGCWCNEDYGWMIELPAEYEHSSSVYDGSHDRFVNANSDAAFYLFVEKNDYQSVEQIRTYMLAQSIGEVVRDEEIIKLSDGTPAFYLELSDSAAILTIHDKYLVAMEFITISSEKFENYREDARKGLKSLTFIIDQAKKPENVSILNEGGYTVFTDKVLGFSVNRMDSWTEPQYIGSNVSVWEYKKYDLLNKLGPDDFFDGEIKVSVFSAEKTDTAESLAKAEKNRILANYNNKFLKDVELKTYTKKGEECAQLNYTIIYNGRKQVNKNKYFVKDEYIYKVEHYILYSADVDESLLDLESIDKMFDSIRVKGVNKEKIGKVIDTTRRFDEKLLQTYKNYKENFEISLPAAWSTAVSSNLVTTTNLKKSIEIEAEIIPELNSLEKARIYFSELYENASFTRLNFSGKNAYKMSFSYHDDYGDIIKGTAYFFVENKETYIAGYMIKEVYETTENNAFLEKIVKTFKPVRR